MEYSRSRMIQNIYSIARIKDVKIGDLESAAGVSTGYISRLAKDDSKGSFTVDLLVSIAEKLGVTLDSLALTDDGTLTDNEMDMLMFLDKMAADTEHYELEWKLMDPRIQDERYLIEHPLFQNKDDGCAQDPDENFHYFSYNQYASRFFPPGKARVNGNCYYAMIDKYSGTEIYLMNVTVADQDYHWEPGYEIYFIRQQEKVTPIMCSKLTCSQLKNAMERLYDAIESARSHLTISDSVKDIMSRYMGGNRKS